MTHWNEEAWDKLDWPTKEEWLDRLHSLIAYKMDYRGYFGVWRIKCAAKEHHDMFGDVIKAREDYWCADTGPTFGNVERLSTRSFATLLHLLFGRLDNLKHHHTNASRLAAGQLEEDKKKQLEDEQRNKPQAQA